MKKSIFKEFKQDEIAKLSNIVGGAQEPTVYEEQGTDTYCGSTSLYDDLSQQDDTTSENDIDLGDCDCPTIVHVFSATPEGHPIGNVVAMFDPIANFWLPC